MQVTPDVELIDPILKLLCQARQMCSEDETFAPGRAVAEHLHEPALDEGAAHDHVKREIRRQPEPSRFAVGLSGGPDSASLAICAAQIARRYEIQIPLLHVHHGLMPQADAWLGQTEQLANLLGMELIVRRVNVDLRQGLGLEASARNARHQALREMALQSGVSYVLLAHHLQDQAETVLQRLLRGAGVSGMAAMRPIASSVHSSDQGLALGGSGLSAGKVWWLRPWLGVTRERILHCVRAFEASSGWSAVEDPSNDDRSLSRGMIRSAIAPLLSEHWPGWAANLARHAEQAQESSELIDEYGRLLLSQVCDSSDVLDLRQWRALSLSQQGLVLRTWLNQAGVQMPSHRRLADLCRQLNQVHAFGHDRMLLWRQTGCEIRCIRGKIHLQVTI